MLSGHGFSYWVLLPGCDFFEIWSCWMVLCYAGQDSIFFFASLDEVLGPFFKFHN